MNPEIYFGIDIKIITFSNVYQNNAPQKFTELFYLFHFWSLSILHYIWEAHQQAVTPLSSRHDPSVERESPPLPTPIIFPQHGKIKGLSQPSNNKPSHSLRERLAQLKKLSDAKIDLFNALNIRLVSINHPVDFFPLNEHHLPPYYWLKLPDDDVFTVLDPRLISSADKVTENPQTRTLGTGRPYPSQEAFITRLKEICLNNADAFGALSRTPPPNGGPVRLAHFRRFWEGLDSMAYYWDTSLDEYIFPAEEQESPATNLTGNNDSDFAVLNDDEPRKRMKSTIWPSPASTHVPNVVSYNEIDKVTIMLRKTYDQQETNSSLRHCRYKGHRTGNGANMPESYRLNTVKAFIEPIAWCFGCNVSAHRRPLLLAIDRLMVPIKLSCAIWRSPVDRSQARAGYLEGPVMGIQCREQINFCRDGPQAQNEASLDLLAEASALLMLAEERAREKGSEKKPGEGKWWTEDPRWGGGVGGEIGDSIDSSDEPTDLKYDNTSASHPKATASASAASSHHKLIIRRKALALRSWKTLSPGSGYWDPKVIYKQIGTEDRSSQDEVFLISCLNHHISFVKLRVQSSYLRHLTSPDTSVESRLNDSSTSPSLQRTQWYDLFEKKDRVEAFCGLWGLFSYLTR